VLFVTKRSWLAIAAVVAIIFSFMSLALASLALALSISTIRLLAYSKSNNKQQEILEREILDWLQPQAVVETALGESPPGPYFLQEILGIHRHKRLVEIDVFNKQFFDLQPISDLQGLRSLSLWCTEVDNIEPIANLQSLELLNLNCTQVRNLEPISGMRSLRVLSLIGVKATDFSPIFRSSSLETVYVSAESMSLIGNIAEQGEVEVIAVETDGSPCNCLLSP
jgi:Leucine-rich repeat (LRR) protein